MHNFMCSMTVAESNIMILGKIILLSCLNKIKKGKSYSMYWLMLLVWSKMSNSLIPTLKVPNKLKMFRLKGNKKRAHQQKKLHFSNNPLYS